MNRAAKILMLASLIATGSACEPSWSDAQKSALRDLRLDAATAPADPTNRYATSAAAARLGKAFFFDARFSANGSVSCASCHIPEKGFQDGRPLGQGVGTTARRTMPIAGVAGAPWFFWDGRKDSLWSQALGPLESAVEHGGDRVADARVIATEYRADYERVFGPLPDLSGLPEHATPARPGPVSDAWMAIPAERQMQVNRVFANLGKAIAAYEATIRPGESRFDHFVDAVQKDDAATADRLLSADEQAGLRLFIGKANCTQCHNGPELTNHDFANIAVPAASGAADDPGRASGVGLVKADAFNCRSPYSDADPASCIALAALMSGPDQLGAFKVPSLRNVAERAPYMHAGQLATLDAVIDHYDRAPTASLGKSALKPLDLSEQEKRQLVAFLGTLSAPIEAGTP